MNNEPVAYLHRDGSLIRVDPRVEVIDPDFIPLYTQQRPHNTVLVPCDKLAEMQAEIDRLKALCISYIDDEWSGTSSYQEKIDEVNNEHI